MKKVLIYNLDGTKSKLDLGIVSTRFSYEINKIEQFNEDSPDLFSTQNILILESKDLAKIESFLKINQLRFELKIVLSLDLSEQGENLKRLINLCSYNLGIKGIIDNTKPIELSLPIFNSFNEVHHEIDGQDLGVLSSSLTTLVEQSMTELQRVKKLHQKLVPIREDEFKGLKFFSKFTAGESSGGDYFDFIKGDHQGLIVLCSTKSYLVTSALMARIEGFRVLGEFTQDDLKSFLNGFIDEVREFGKDTSDVSVDLILFDMKKGKVFCERFGNSSLKIDSLNCEKSFEAQLKRESRFFLTSDGYFLNAPDGIDGRPIGEFLEGISKRNSKDYLDEAIIKIKTGYNQKFIKYDATLIVIEVPKNAFFEV